jgi:hypothetical protein
MVTDPTDIDPYDCEDCVVVSGICAYHQGWADGWDCAATVAARYAFPVAEGDG